MAIRLRKIPLEFIDLFRFHARVDDKEVIKGSMLRYLTDDPLHFLLLLKANRDKLFEIQI
jgi:hypothetical protein